MELMIEDLMQELVENGGSDLHIASGQPPMDVSAASCGRCVMKLCWRRAVTG